MISLILGVALQSIAPTQLPLFSVDTTVAAYSAPAPAGRPVPVRSDTLVFNALTGATTVPMSRPIDGEVVVDGHLNEPVWRSARILTGFSLYSPADGRPAPDSTEVLVWYSNAAIHFGIRAFEPHGAVRATLADRDRVNNDDNVEIHIDTFEERRRAFVFIVNPLGVQADGTKNEGGGFTPGSNVSPGQNDLNPDFQWQSRGRVTDGGYEVEIRIPFSSLRFQTAREQRWGLQIKRNVQHSGYEETWTPALRGSASFIAQQGYLTGLTDMHHGVDLQVNPELTNTVRGATCCQPGNESWKYENKPRVGGNIRAGIGSNLVVVGTIRPDFSQVEADATQVAADTRFALFYAERRPFFVEGSDQFNVPNTLVYTRRIVQPEAALKMNVRRGRTNFALLSAVDASSTADKNDRPLADVIRITRDFREQSTAGFVYSDRISKNRENRMMGADMRLLFGRMYYAQFQYAGSQSNTNGVRSSGALWEAVVDRTGRGWGFHYNLTGIQPGFRTDNGFVARTGFVQPNAANRITLFGKPGALFERNMMFVSTSGLWQYGDFFAGKSMLEGRVSVSNSLTLRKGWSISVNPAMATYAFRPETFAHLATDNGTAAPDAFVPTPRLNTFTGTMSVSTPQYRRGSASAGVTSAKDVDFAETSRVRRTAFTGSLDLRPNERLRINATYASNEFVRTIDGFSSFSTRIPRVKLEYQVTRPFFVRLVSQYEANRREALTDYRTGLPLLVKRQDGTYAPSSRTLSNVLRADLLFSYRPRPGTVLFAGYGNTMTEPEALGFDRLRRVNDGFFLKASWVFTRSLLTP
jgi:hypothetical protein